MKRLLFALPVLLTLTMCQQKKTDVEEPDIEALRTETKPTEVILGNSRADNFELRINSNGIIAAAQSLEITVNASGALKTLDIKNGSKVNSSQLLGAIENTAENLALERAQIAYKKALVQFQNDSIGYSNLTEEARNNLELSAGLRDAEINLKEAQINKEKTLIKAPFRGVIADMEKKLGDQVGVGEKIGKIYTPNQLVMEAKVLETDYSNLKVGLLADIFPLALKEKSFTATLIEINPIVDDNGMISVKLKLNETQGLLPGMNAQCIIRVPVEESILVPKEAVVIKSGRPVVFTFEEGYAKWNYVETGLENGTDVQIVSGLEAGKQVILSNNLQLAHDAKVSLANTSLNSN